MTRFWDWQLFLVWLHLNIIYIVYFKMMLIANQKFPYIHFFLRKKFLVLSGLNYEFLIMWHICDIESLIGRWHVRGFFSFFILFIYLYDKNSFWSLFSASNIYISSVQKCQKKGKMFCLFSQKRENWHFLAVVLRLFTYVNVHHIDNILYLYNIYFCRLCLSVCTYLGKCIFFNAHVQTGHFKLVKNLYFLWSNMSSYSSFSPFFCHTLQNVKSTVLDKTFWKLI